MTYKQLKIKRNIWARESYNVVVIYYKDDEVYRKKIYKNTPKFNSRSTIIITNPNWVLNMKEKFEE